MDNPLPALRASVGRLHELCRGLDEAQLEARSFCSEWSIAGVLSHLGSSAVIMRRRLEDALAGRSTPDDFAPSVWDGWNAKSPRAQADDALVEDEGLLEAFEALPGVDRARLGFPMGPLTLDFDHVVAMRLNEHALHTWDIEVVFDDDARLPADAAAVVVDNLDLIARFTARPTGEERTVARGHDRSGPTFHPSPRARQRRVHRCFRGRVGARRPGPRGRSVLPARLRPPRSGPHAASQR